MDEFIKMLDPALDYVEHISKGQNCLITVESNREVVTCPYCGTESTRVHSVYKREFQDLPIQDYQVVIQIRNRKMFCDNPECDHKTFSERFNFITYKARKTERLIKKILILSSRVSSVSASSMLKSDTAAVSKSTICRLLKKNASDCG
ncbi:transposase family protein [Dehalobacter sp. TeCB1]|uniref:transposase family protein n=1 Tax=Dehalobacter sp. TeCB1 TaxID=1843715 RepID=UPI00083A45D8|nr:transposase family protein [Dehalobacter sp. TeCB1]OCZ49691.1 transposase [Dehalobacter sp. TeCB1]